MYEELNDSMHLPKESVWKKSDIGFSSATEMCRSPTDDCLLFTANTSTILVRMQNLWRDYTIPEMKTWEKAEQSLQIGFVCFAYVSLCMYVRSTGFEHKQKSVSWYKHRCTFIRFIVHQLGKPSGKWTETSIQWLLLYTMASRSDTSPKMEVTRVSALPKWLRDWIDTASHRRSTE